MGVHGFAIATNHPFNKYKAGQTVRGKVHFELDEKERIRGVYIKVKGVAKVSWTESKTEKIGGKSRTVSVRYYGEHEFFNDKLYLNGSENDEFDLPRGNYDYKFDYDLPIGLPSTYEGTYGDIRYTVLAALDIPWGFNDEELIVLEVISPIDLNINRQLKNPYNATRTKHLCCLWCRSGPLTMEINIPKTGYAYGEDIPIRVDIENLSNSLVDYVECTLKRKITFHSEYPSHHTKTSNDTLCDLRSSSVQVRSSKTFDQKLSIPNITCLNFENCNLFQLSHILEIVACISGCHCNLSVEVPVTLGGIPIRSDPSTPLSKSILVGLGTPYPHETQRHGASSLNQQPSAPPYLSDVNYGWMECAKGATP